MEFMNGFYSDIGNKIKGLAKVIFVLSAIACIIISCVGMYSAIEGLNNVYDDTKADSGKSNTWEEGMWNQSSDLSKEMRAALDQMYTRRLLFSILFFFIGPVISMIGTWCLYGFGELIENSSIGAYDLRQINRKTVATVEKTINKEAVPQKKKTASGYDEEKLMHLDNGTLALLYLDKKITQEEYDLYKKN